ncbi:hypothetical protein N9M68_04050 [Candidatus Poseidonia alphae]|nr:hypothetical protein [Candidatus Poseidonia alphae]
MGAYADVLNHVFNAVFTSGDTTVDFSMTQLRNAATELGLEIRNPPDIIAHFRSRNDLPTEITTHGNWVLESVSRGNYRLSRINANPYFEINYESYEQVTLDIDEDILQYIGSDEQAYISLMHHSGALARFFDVERHNVKHLQNHFKTNVNRVQMEADDFNLLVFDERDILVGIEAKGVSRVERLNRVQQQQIRLLISTLFPNNGMRIMGLKGMDNRNFALVEFSNEDIETMSPTRGMRIRLNPVNLRP